MPTYEYECRDCHYNFERFQSMSDEPVRICPQCGGSVRRMIGGGSGIIFKGSGFYINDSRKSTTGSPSPSKAQVTESKGTGGAKAPDSAAGKPAAPAAPAAPKAANESA